MTANDALACRVCGLLQAKPPWGENNKDPSFEICPCCGVEFGYEDNQLESIKDYRASWIAQGAHWFIEKQRPSGWSIEEQMKSIPRKFV